MDPAKEIMSWLFEDPINSGLAQFDHTQSNSKTIINIILICLLAPFIVQNFKKFFQRIQSYEDDINLLVKYWRLKNTEISLAESHFWL